MLFFICFLLVLFSFLGSPVHARNLITNGSFEQGNFTSANPVGDRGMTRLKQGDSNLANWQIVSDEIAWQDASNPYMVFASDGSRFLDLTGYTDGQPHGGVRQTVNLIPGKRYRLSFDIGYSMLYPTTPSGITVSVTGSQSQTFRYTGTTSANSGWQKTEYFFTATSSQTLITMVASAETATSGQYVGLDSVVLMQDLPDVQRLTTPIQVDLGVTVAGSSRDQEVIVISDQLRYCNHQFRMSGIRYEHISGPQGLSVVTSAPPSGVISGVVIVTTRFAPGSSGDWRGRLLFDGQCEFDSLPPSTVVVEIFGRAESPVKKFRITSVNMRNASKLDIHTDRDFSGQTLPIDISVIVNGRVITPPQFVKAGNRPSDFLGRYESDPIRVTLSDYQIPRFEDNAIVEVRASVNFGGGAFTDTRRVAIPLPIVLVPGITSNLRSDTLFGGDGVFPAFEDYLRNGFSDVYDQRGYQFLSEGNPSEERPWYPFYPTLSTVKFRRNADRNSANLSVGGQYVKETITRILRNTYANRVNIVAHSKGTLLTRAMLTDPAMRDKVRNCFLVQGPHTGSVYSTKWYADFGNLYYNSSVFKNLFPVWNFYRTSSSQAYTIYIANQELIQLNSKSLPDARRFHLRYHVYFGQSEWTAATITDGYINSFTYLPGDGVVTVSSQKGRIYDGNRPNAQQPLIPAFQANRIAFREIPRHNNQLPSVSHTNSLYSNPTFWREIWEHMWSIR